MVFTLALSPTCRPGQPPKNAPRAAVGIPGMESGQPMRAGTWRGLPE